MRLALMAVPHLPVCSHFPGSHIPEGEINLSVVSQQCSDIDAIVSKVLRHYCCAKFKSIHGVLQNLYIPSSDVDVVLVDLSLFVIFYLCPAARLDNQLVAISGQIDVEQAMPGDNFLPPSPSRASSATAKKSCSVTQGGYGLDHCSLSTARLPSSSHPNHPHED